MNFEVTTYIYGNNDTNIRGICIKNDMNTRILYNNCLYNVTGNCQLWTIQNFAQILALQEKWTKKDFKSLISKIKKVAIINKPYLLIDINQAYKDRLNKFLKIFGEIPYHSRTGSNMVTLIIDLTK